MHTSADSQLIEHSSHCPYLVPILPYGRRDLYKAKGLLDPLSSSSCVLTMLSQSGVEYQRCAQWASRFALKAFTEVEWTTLSGRAFQSLTALIANADLLALQVALGFRILREWPRVTWFSTKVKYCSGLMSTPPLSIWYKYIMSPRLRL